MSARRVVAMATDYRRCAWRPTANLRRQDLVIWQTYSASESVGSATLLRAGLINQGCRGGDGLQAFDWDGLAGDFAQPVGSLFDTVERSVDLRQFNLIPGIFVDLCFSLVKE